MYYETLGEGSSHNSHSRDVQRDRGCGETFDEVFSLPRDQAVSVFGSSRFF